jgi:glyoxylase-like metal-dependent hydrolase (beta-lactamase superfamily II)
MRAIDTRHLGIEKVICCWEVDGVLIDPGPQSTEATLLEALDGQVPRAILLTHIHFDHAGATGALVQRWPDLPVYVHERGARHMATPERLVASAARLYGGEDGLRRLWGEVVPVPEANLRSLSGGETVLDAFRVEYTPGHASHHVSYLHEASGTAFVGDVAGVRIPPYEHVVAPTPPPDIDIEAWLDSLHKVASWNPQSLCLTHFGQVTDVADHLHRIRCALADSADSARMDGEERFIARIESELTRVTDPATMESFEQAAPPDQLYQGLARYWRKRAE